MNSAIAPHNSRPLRPDILLLLRSLCLLCLLCLPGCTTPASVAPLLELTRQALADESQYLQDDLAHHRQYLAAQRADLEAAYTADLSQQAAPTPAWIIEATHAYVAAREELLRREYALAQAHADRRDNLQAAREAQDRALAILGQQDALIRRLTTGLKFPQPATQPLSPELR